jgi:hypothetical protein
LIVFLSKMSDFTSPLEDEILGEPH